MFDKSIVCCYLYVISKYGYPPAPEKTVQHLQEMKAMGFRTVELEGIRRNHLLKIFELRFEIQNALQGLDLKVPYFCVVLPGLASDQPDVREENLELFEKGCKIGQLIGANGILDNAPLPPYRFPDNIPLVRHYDEKVLRVASFPLGLNWKNYWNDLISTYRTACDIAKERNLTYLMHPCMGVLSATSDAFLYFHDAVRRDNLRFNLDTANQFVLKDNLPMALLRLADYIDYIHLSDNRGTKVEHLMPGKGLIHWDFFFEMLNRINFGGYLGLDIGGEESGLKNIEQVYREAARWVKVHWLT